MERGKYLVARMIIHLTMAIVGAYLILIARIDMAFMWYLGLGIGVPIIALDMFRAYYVWPRVVCIREAKMEGRHIFVQDEVFLKNFEARYEWWFSVVYHQGEMGKFSSGVWYFLGMVVTYGIACVIDMPWLAGFAILFQGVADPAARFIGLRWPIMPIPEWKGKSFGGFLAAFVVSVCVGLCALALIMPATYGISKLRIMFCIGVGATFAAIAEANSRRFMIDDNFIIPVASVVGMIFSLH